MNKRNKKTFSPGVSIPVRGIKLSQNKHVYYTVIGAAFHGKQVIGQGGPEVLSKVLGFTEKVTFKKTLEGSEGRS